MRSPTINALTILIVLEGLVGTLGVLPVLKHILDPRALPTIFGGIRALSGPFEALGNDAGDRTRGSEDGLTIMSLRFGNRLSRGAPIC